MLFRLLLACGGNDGDTAVDAAPIDPCGGPPAVEILSPAAGDVYTEGERVVLNGDGAGVGTLLYQWGVDGDSAGTGRAEDWVASGEGSHVVTLQITDDCDVGQASVSIRVSPP